MTDHQHLPPLPLPSGITERQVDTQPTSLSFHILEAGFTSTRDRPLIVLLHGFPELAYSWRKVMPLLAEAGYYVVALDQRGYGRTTGWDTAKFEDVDLRTFSVINLIRDVVVLVNALGYHSVRCVAGHDFGAVSAALCALARPDFFESVVVMSHPFKGTSALPLNTANAASSSNGTTQKKTDVHQDLAQLSPPRKHYKWYYSTQPANAEMTYPTDGLHTFLRGYFHLKSADWSGNHPHPLKEWSAESLSEMPYYYIMPHSAGMRESVSLHMKTEDPKIVSKKSPRWLSDEELAVYVQEYARTGFQGGLNWYRVQTNPHNLKDLDVFAGKKIEVPCMFISGREDWGTYQEPGAVENMEKVCTNFRGVKLVDGAGHWVPQERPEEVVEGILGLIGSI